MTVDAFIADSATELRSFGLWVVTGDEHLWAAHFVPRPAGEPAICGPRKPSDTWEQPHWQITFHDRLADVYGYPLDVACEKDQESGMTGAPNRATAEHHCYGGFIYLCDFNGINRNTGRWNRPNAPKWRFANKIQNIIGAPDPHGVIQVTNDLTEAYDWMKAYNQCGEFCVGGQRFVDASK